MFPHAVRPAWAPHVFVAQRTFPYDIGALSYRKAALDTKSAKENTMRKTGLAIVSMLLMILHSPLARADDAALPQPVTVVISFLQLSEGQANDLLRMIRDRDTAIQPIAQTVQTNREALARLLESPAPDPATAGQLLIEIHDGEKRIGEQAQAAAASFLVTLTADQRQRMQFIIMAAQVAPAVPAFKALGLI